MRIRQSQMSTWQECRRKHTFAYSLGVKPLREGPRMPAGSNRDAGTAFHAGVAALNEGKNMTEALQIVANIVDEMRGENDELTKESHRGWWEVKRLAMAMTVNYESWQAEGNDVGCKTLAVEHKWEVNLPLSHSMFGAIDLVMEDPVAGGVVVRDYKTVATFGQPPLDNDFQLLTYAWAWWRETGTKPVRAEHLMAKRVLGTSASAKKPFFERYSIPTTEKILLNHERQLEARAVEMALTAAPDLEDPYLWPNPTATCHWKCDYKDVCPMVDDGSDWVYTLESSFEPIEAE